MIHLLVKRTLIRKKNLINKRPIHVARLTDNAETDCSECNFKTAKHFFRPAFHDFFYVRIDK